MFFFFVVVFLFFVDGPRYSNNYYQQMDKLEISYHFMIAHSSRGFKIRPVILKG